MVDASQNSVPGRLKSGNNFSISGTTFALLAFLIDALVIIVVASATGLVYHEVVYNSQTPLNYYPQFGVMVALFFCLPFIFKDKYNYKSYVIEKIEIERIFLVWNFAFFCVALIGFLTKTTGMVSRGHIVLFYCFGYIFVVLARRIFLQLVKTWMRAGYLAARKVLLVGDKRSIDQFTKRYEPWRNGLQVVNTVALWQRDEDRASAPVQERVKRRLSRAAAEARLEKVNDVFILLPWSDDKSISQCVDAFMVLPVALHLGPERIMDRFAHVNVSKIGSISSLHLTGQPLTPLQVMAKRGFDIVASFTGLVVLSPLFLIIAALIKLDSPGQAFFRQQRLGFNHKPFRIFKFRTMTTTDDGAIIPQARKNDPRTTRVGRFLRRFNIDELPQLLNVLRGEMSIVGPRPHAVAHDRAFENKIMLYARRHNVKPGITGWAQINGLRGPTETDEKMRQRVELDLYYIDHWSVFFDLYIVVMTLVSPKAYRNAV